MCVGSRSGGRRKAKELALGGCKGDIGEVILGSDEWKACDANVNEWEELEEEPAPAQVCPKGTRYTVCFAMSAKL